MRNYRILYVLMFLPLVVLQVLWFVPGVIIGYTLLGWMIPLGMMCYGYIKGGENHWYQHFPINGDGDYYDFENWYYAMSVTVWLFPIYILETIREYGKGHRI